MPDSPKTTHCTFEGGPEIGTTVDVPCDHQEMCLYRTPDDGSGIKRLIYRRVGPNRFRFVRQEPYVSDAETSRPAAQHNPNRKGSLDVTEGQRRGVE